MPWNKYYIAYYRTDAQLNPAEPLTSCDHHHLPPTRFHTTDTGPLNSLLAEYETKPYMDMYRVYLISSCIGSRRHPFNVCLCGRGRTLAFWSYSSFLG